MSKIEMDKALDKNQQQTINASLGLVLGGGAARGYAHIGVIKALESLGIKPAAISGTSMGALIGVLYAAGYTSSDILQLIDHKSISEFLKLSWNKQGLFSLEKVKTILDTHLKSDDFSSLSIPFYLAVTNLNSGKIEYKSEGPLIDFVLASCSIPLVFKPILIQDMYYTDGGVLDNLPIFPLLTRKAYPLIVSSVNSIAPIESLQGMWELADRTFTLLAQAQEDKAKEEASLFLRPPALSKYNLWDFSKLDELVEIGYSYTLQAMEKAMQTQSLIK
jgi:NTE family protein